MAVLIPALTTALLLPLAAIVVSLPQRVANWKIREGHLRVELERIQDACERAIKDREAAAQSQRHRLLGGGTHVIVQGSGLEKQLGEINRETEALREAATSEARHARSAIERELDASWWTHTFADECQGGRQPSLRDVLPPKQA